MKEMRVSMSGGQGADHTCMELDCTLPDFDDVLGLSTDLTPTCPEMLDLDDVFPDLTVISTGQSSIAEQPELYCFEDFEGDVRVDGMREEDCVTEYRSTLYSTLQALLHTGELQCIKGKELLRSKTLPVISLPITVNGELVSHPPSARVPSVHTHVPSSPKNSTASSNKSSRSSPSLSESSSSDGKCKHRPRSTSEDRRPARSMCRNSNQYRDKCNYSISAGDMMLEWHDNKKGNGQKEKEWAEKKNRTIGNEGRAGNEQKKENKQKKKTRCGCEILG